jgi:ABC-type transport system involved in cytochrome c biogenesis permease component
MSDSTFTDPILPSHEDAIRILVDGDTVWDRRLIRTSNWLNPILVKETRQALKSKQFSWTFTLLIFFTIAWTLIAVMSSIPNVYYDSDGATFLSGYLIILMLPSMIVIPQTTFRSMASELEDGTFETLSLSMLTPAQVVYGKLSVAALQLVLYMSILAPCIALTYLLQRVTLEAIAALLLINVLVSMFLCTTSIFLSTIGRSRTMQILFSVLMVLMQFFAILMMFPFLGASLSLQSLGYEGWTGIGCTSLALLGYGWLEMRCAASAIDLASANRSTPVRIAVFVVGMTIAMVGVAAMLINNITPASNEFPTMVLIVATLCWIHWGIAGAWMMGESGIITHRARRSLPDSFFGRLLFTWFNPGAGPGYLLVLLGFLGPWIGFFALMNLFAAGFPRSWVLPSALNGSLVYIGALAAYLALYLGIVRLLLLLVFRKSRESRLLLSFAMLFVIVIVAMFLSLMMSLIAGDFRDMDYEWFCFINPVWTLGEFSDGMINSAMFNSGAIAIAWLALSVSATIVFVINALLTSRDVMISRIETPARVLAERPKRKPEEEIDPWKES